MWIKSYSMIVKDVSLEDIWAVWTDINQWASWQEDIEHALLEGEFKEGATFAFKPKGAPKTLQLLLSDVVFNSYFTDVTTFPFAKMYGKHELIRHDNGIEVKTTISIEGPLAWVWRKIVAENIVADLPKQTNHLIKQVRKLHPVQVGDK